MDWKNKFHKLFFKEKEHSKAFDLKFKNKPRYVYKYFPANDINEFNTRVGLIKTDQSWFSDPYKFNDPFDSSYSVDFRNLGLPGGKQQFKSALVVSAFSEKYKSILMWSHYASCHKGFCVRYNLSKVEKENIFFKAMYPVVYQRNFLEITKKHKDSKEINNGTMSWVWIQATLTKALEWSYEKEWRAIENSSFSGSREFLPIDAIYCGARMTLENKRALNELSEIKGLSIYHMKMFEDEFKLKANRYLTIARFKKRNKAKDYLK